MEHILERKADFESFKNGSQVIERTCNTIQSSISLWKEYLENMMENNQSLCESESDSYHWLSLDGLKSIISMNPYEYFPSEELRTKKKSQFLLTTNRTYVNMVSFIQWQHGRANISQKIYTLQWNIHLIKIYSLRVC